MKTELIKPDYLFEVSWEVCNKVGGIYTVVATKSLYLKSEYNRHHIMVGPDVWMDTDSNPDFLEDPTLYRAWRLQAASEGLRVRVGRWNVPGKPTAILVDFKQFLTSQNEILTEFWKKFQVDSLTGNWDYRESALFGYAAGRVIESFYRFNLDSSDKVVAQFHEWMTGTGLLYLKSVQVPIATVFTTHATVIGRCIAGNNLPLYDGLLGYNADEKARQFNVVARHSLEKKAAQYSDVFTTVSDITAQECRQFLGRPVDVVTPNGFEPSFTPATDEEYEEQRAAARNRLVEVAAAMSGEAVPENAVLIGIGGRYEWKNKGIDVFIEAMNRLGRDRNLNKQVLALVEVPAWVGEPREDLVERLSSNEKFDTPLECPVITHWLNDMSHDNVTGMMKYHDMWNRPEDKVKLIFVPCYLDGKDGVINISYYDVIIGKDLSVYPSYYEPWGYTPLESVAFHVPCVTTSLSGFGMWANSVKGGNSTIMDGVEVIRRTDYNYSEVADRIKETVSDFSLLSDKEVEEIRKKAKKLSDKALWKNFIKYYYEAYDIALKNRDIRVASK